MACHDNVHDGTTRYAAQYDNSRQHQYITTALLIEAAVEIWTENIQPERNE
jgi:hypothetical protein